MICWKWFLFPAFFLIPVISFIFTLKIAKYEFEVRQNRTDGQRKLSYYSYILNNDVVYKENKMLDISDHLFTLYKNKYKQYYDKDVQILQIQSAIQLIFHITEAIIGCGIVYMVVKSSVAGKILMGTVYSFIASIWGSISSADNVAKDIAMLLRICGFYDNYEGKILINGYSFQDFSEYAFTVDENLNLGDIKAVNKDRIYNKFNQLREYGLLSFVEKLPKKINTQLGYFFKDGIQISGGEWQQLALARSIMKDSSLYILDEPCSSLDLQTENKVFDYLKSTTTDNICLLISHRLHNIVHFADYVMVYNKGKLIEYDTVDNLLKSDSIFKNDFFNCEALTEVTF